VSAFAGLFGRSWHLTARGARLAVNAINLRPGFGQQGLKTVRHTVSQRARGNAIGVMDADYPALAAIVVNL
jgi:hypothetical protein